MFERFTESARRAVYSAREQAVRLRASEIGTDHLLWGVIHEGAGVLKAIPALQPVPLEAVVAALEARADAAGRAEAPDEMPIAESTLKALRTAAEEADRLGHSYIGTEHLLLALIKVVPSPAATILEAQGMRLDETRTGVVKWLEDARPPGAASVTVDMSTEIERLRGIAEQLRLHVVDDGRAGELFNRLIEGLDRLRQDLGR